MKHLTSQEVLEVIGEMAEKTLPKGSMGNLSLKYDDSHGIEIYFIPSIETTPTSN